MKILIALSSPLVRINGITKFIEELTKIFHYDNHSVDFITDAKPNSEYDLTPNFDNYYFDTATTSYPDLRVKDKPGVVDVIHIPEITERITNVYANIKTKYDLIISNDAQCTAALNDTGICLHYVHTAGLLPGIDVSFLNESYIEFEREVMQQSRWVGLNSEALDNLLGSPVNGVVLGLPLTSARKCFKPGHIRQGGVLFAGEGTFRKGADIFERTLKQLPRTKSKLMCSSTSEVTFDKLKNKEIVKFNENEQGEKREFMQSAKVTFFPSRGETIGYGLLEAMISSPALVYSEFPWTKIVIPLGAIPTNDDNVVHDLIKGLHGDLPHYPLLVINYFDTSKRQWLEFVNNLKQ